MGGAKVLMNFLKKAYGIKRVKIDEQLFPHRRTNNFLFFNLQSGVVLLAFFFDLEMYPEVGILRLVHAE